MKPVRIMFWCCILSFILIVLTVCGESRTITVPVNDIPVMTDGIFSNGEWDGAESVQVSEKVIVLLKQYKGMFYLGIRCPELRSPVSDLVISSGGTTLQQFHVSAQLYEAELNPGEDLTEDAEYGKTSDWYANEIRWNYALSQKLQGEGVDRNEAQLRSMYPHEGHEFMFRASKFSGSNLKIWIRILHSEDWETGVIIPEGTSLKSFDGWLEMQL